MTDLYVEGDLTDCLSKVPGEGEQSVQLAGKTNYRTRFYLNLSPPPHPIMGPVKDMFDILPVYFQLQQMAAASDWRNDKLTYMELNKKTFFSNYICVQQITLLFSCRGPVLRTHH